MLRRCYLAFVLLALLSAFPRDCFAGYYSKQQFGGTLKMFPPGGGEPISQNYWNYNGNYGAIQPGYAGAVSCTETIYTVFTWVSLGPLDVPPANVIITDSVSAYAEGYSTGTPVLEGDSDMGTAPTFSPVSQVNFGGRTYNYRNMGFSESRITSHPFAPQFVVVCTPLAKALTEYSFVSLSYSADIMDATGVVLAPNGVRGVSGRTEQLIGPAITPTFSSLRLAQTANPTPTLVEPLSPACRFEKIARRIKQSGIQTVHLARCKPGTGSKTAPAHRPFADSQSPGSFSRLSSWRDEIGDLFVLEKNAEFVAHFHPDIDPGEISPGNESGHLRDDMVGLWMQQQGISPSSGLG